MRQDAHRLGDHAATLSNTAAPGVNRGGGGGHNRSHNRGLDKEVGGRLQTCARSWEKTEILAPSPRCRNPPQTGTAPALVNEVFEHQREDANAKVMRCMQCMATSRR